MRKVKLYELKVTEVIARGMVVEKHTYPDIGFSTRKVCGEDTLLQSMARRVELPVERIRRIEHGVLKEDFIALDDNLREVLEAPFRSRIAALELRYRLAETQAEDWHDEAEKMQRRIDSLNALPWYRRLFRKV